METIQNMEKVSGHDLLGNTTLHDLAQKYRFHSALDLWLRLFFKLTVTH